MLTDLSIRDYAIVQRLDIELHDGMTCVTGEVADLLETCIDKYVNSYLRLLCFALINTKLALDGVDLYIKQKDIFAWYKIYLKKSSYLCLFSFLLF